MLCARLSVLCVCLVASLSARAAMPGCTVVDQASIAASEGPFTQQLFLTSAATRQVVFANDARRLLVGVRPLSEMPSTLRVRLFVKQHESDPFAEVCSTSPAPFVHDDSRLIGFEMPYTAVRWRVQVEQQPDPVGLGLILLTSPAQPAEAGPLNAGRQREGILDFVCINPKDAALARALERLEPTFLERNFVVAIDDREAKLSPDMLAAIQDEFTRALEAWHFALKLPQLGGVAIVFRTAGGDRLLVNRRLVQFLRARGLPAYDPSNLVSAAFYEGLDLDLAVTTLRNLRTQFAIDGATYEPLDPNDIAARRLCSVPPGVLHSPLDLVQGALGCSRNRSDLTVEISLSLVNGPTRCGQQSFACEGAKLVELDVRDFAFQEYGTGRTLLGQGIEAVDLRLLLIHEIGHALGLDHDRSGVMARVPSETACLTASSVAAIADRQHTVKPGQ